MVDWFDLLPPLDAKAMITSERRRASLRMRAAGLTLEEMAVRLGVKTKERARQIVAAGDRGMRFGFVSLDVFLGGTPDLKGGARHPTSRDAIPDENARARYLLEACKCLLGEPIYRRDWLFVATPGSPYYPDVQMVGSL